MRKDKTKDMIRSILPSKDREAARIAKALRNRETRRGVRADIRRANYDADVYRSANLRDVVDDRRADDKLNHFMRWCEAMTAGMTIDEALAYVRSILPHDVIGDHAYGHWEVHRRYFRERYPSLWEYGRRGVQSSVDSMTFRLRRALIVDPTLHARLNFAIKRRKPADQPRRLLAGVHDIEAFVRQIARSREAEAYSSREILGPHDLERAITLELIEQIEKTKGGRKVALRVFRRRSPAARSCGCSGC